MLACGCHLYGKNTAPESSEVWGGKDETRTLGGPDQHTKEAGLDVMLGDKDWPELGILYFIDSFKDQLFLKGFRTSKWVASI